MKHNNFSRLFIAPLSLALATPGIAQWGEESIASGLPMGSTSSVDSGDLDGDGDQDVVFVSPSSGAIIWLETLPAPGAPVSHIVPGTAGGSFVHLIDADVDGDLDLAAIWGGQLSWLENDGLGGTWTAHAIANPNSFESLAADLEFADLDGDGDPDFVATTMDAQGLGYTSLVLYNNQAGLFVHEQTFVASQSIRSFGMGDFDGDGDLDLLNPNTDWNPSPWLRNDSTPGNFAFDWTGSHPVSSNPLPTDFDGDGDVDFIHVNGGSIWWSDNLGSGNFGPLTILVPTHPSGGTRYYGGDLADLDGDGDDDFIVVVRPTNATSTGTRSRIAWYENLGNSTLGPRQDLVADAFHLAGLGFALVDFDGDQDLDVIGTERTTSALGDILWHRNDHHIGSPVSVFCIPTTNSTGNIGQLSISGSALIDQNSMALTATHLPPNVIGYFLGATQAANGIIPPGSSGFLCLGGAIGRFNASSEIQSSDSNGLFLLPLDLNALATPTGPMPVQSGETRVFQAWHRDPASNTSNFTSAIEVMFQ